MSLSMARENYVLHKLHSLTGIVPIGFYMVQHITLNSFSLAGPDKFNGVIHFFETVPPHLLLGVEIFVLWLPMLFHAVYGTMIAFRARPNYFAAKYRWSENRMFEWQRWTGILLFIFLIYHVISTTGVKYMQGVEHIEYAAMAAKFTSNLYLELVVYLLGTAAAAYHLAYGIWNFCIRWGITISERAQRNIAVISGLVFVLLTLIAWGALAGFLIHGSGAAHATTI
jgi:succinate dehydrogenase / fumarate reductase cytochrome b subunit